MKNSIIFLLTMLFGFTSLAQDKLYFVFEFMKVEEQNETAYLETEKFWEGIHDQRLKSGDLVGWELWKLKSEDEQRSYQYLTITAYDNPVKMLGEWGDVSALAKKAFPKLTDDQISKKMDRTALSRELAVRYYLERVDKTNDSFAMPIGTIANICMMKVNVSSFNAYEKAEKEVFKPMHQKEIDNGQRASWSLMRFISPVGSDTYASHITMNIYKDFNQLFDVDGDVTVYTEAEQKEMDEGMEKREMKYVHTATLLRKVK